MAVSFKNANFFKYLQEAFRHKVYRDKGATSFKYLDYNLPYKSIGSIKGIFDYARKVLPSFYTNEFPNTEEGNLEMAKKLLEKLDKRQDIELERSFNPPAVSAEHEQLIAEAQAASQQATAGQEAPAAAATTGGPGLPFTPSVSSAPRTTRIIRDIPHVPDAETPKSELVATNKSGVVVGEKPEASTKIITANKSGVVAEAPPSKIFIANKSGSVVGERTITPPQKLRPGFRMPASFTNAAKNFTSTLGRSFYRNIGSRLNPNALLNRMFNVIGGLGGSLGAMGGNPGIPSGGIFGSVKRSVLSGRNGWGFRTGFSKTPGLSKLKGFGTGKKIALAFTLFGAFFGFSLFAAILQPSTTLEASPQTSSLLDYTLPFLDATVTPLDIKDQVKAAFPGAKLEYWDLIVQKSIEAGFNPALALALWIEETGASQATFIRNGGSEILTNGNLSKGHLGCAPKEDQTIDESLSCLFKFVQAHNLTASQFTQFMEKYSGGPAGAPFSNNTSFPNGIKSWYARLVPSGAGALTLINTTTVSSCPALGPISTPYGFNIPDYPDVGNEGCGNLTICHNGIDIAANEGSLVKSPINGTIALVSSAQYKGNYLEINGNSDLKVTLEHLATITKNQGATVTQGEIVGTVGHTGEGVKRPVLHFKMTKGGVLINPFRTLGSSATLNSNVLTSSDDVSQNNYANVPYTGTNWGSCNQ